MRVTGSAEGLEVWFAPFPPELSASELIELSGDCAERAEPLRPGALAFVLG